MDRGAWEAAVHRVAMSRTRLSDFTFTFHFHSLEKEIATHSSVLSWRIPGTEEPGGLLSIGSHRVGYDWSNLAAAAACKRVPEKHLFLLYWLCQSPWLCGSQQTVENSERDENICKQVRKQQLELDMEQQTGSKLGKEYIKAICCHPAYLTYMQSTSWETLGWMKHKLNQDARRNTSDMQMTPPLWQKAKKN